MTKPKKLKIRELIKDLDVNAIEAVKVLNTRGFNYKSFNSDVKMTEIEELKEALLLIEKEAIERSEKHKDLSKAKFIGVVKDKSTGKFKRLLLKVKLSDLEGIEHDLVEIAENQTIFGAKIELANDIMKNLVTDPVDFE